jgi:uncharacterized protein YaiL (DUF2058 family)
MDIILKTAIGVFIGGLAAAFTYEGIQTFRLQVATHEAASQLIAAGIKANAQEEKAKQDEALRQAKIQADEWQRLQAAQQVAAQAAESRKLQTEKRAEAWRRYYQPTEGCRRDPVQTDCANAHIKAKITFESQYTPPS